MLKWYEDRDYQAEAMQEIRPRFRNDKMTEQEIEERMEKDESLRDR